ncbi:MAG: tetratricopeptide repeat protein [Proteobacteria bacterium]|nr:tetratricopeptide repeat protein [Pseudomonadota bacterium]
MRTPVGKASSNEDSPASRIRQHLARDHAGVHRLGRPIAVLDSELPDSLSAVYRSFDGGELYHGIIVLRPSVEVCRDLSVGGDRDLPPFLRETTLFRVGEHNGDDLYVEGVGRVFRHEKDTGEWLAEGTRFDRWLLGMVEAEALLYDSDGEFIDGVFEDSGELEAEMVVRMNRRILARDRRAPAPRWRLARALARQGQLTRARDQLETAVADHPAFAWAWFDLAQISEKMAEPGAAIDELCAAAEAIPGYQYAGFFWAHAARIAVSMGDEARRVECADKALARDADLMRTQREGASATLATGDLESALILAELAAALAPRDVVVLDLVRAIRARLADRVATPH